MNHLKSIDLFAGIGGIRLGFDKAFADELQTVFVSEWDEYAQKTYKANFHDDFEIAGDITKIKEEDVPAFDICLAGFPCQAFSLAGQRLGFEDNYKGMCRGTLFQDVARICENHKPKVIFCENVKGLVIHDKGRTFKIICNTFMQLGYKVFSKVLNSKNFGVPQNRERIYIVAFRNDIAPDEFIFPEKTDDTKRLRDIIEKEPVPAKYYLSDVYVETLRRHKARHAAKGNGFGYEIREWDGIAGAIVCGGMGRERNLLIDKRQTDLVPATHIKGEINKEGIRKMTPREWARLQGFPDSFALPLADVHLYKQFGNSVTVNVIEAIAKKIKEVLDMSMKANKGEWSEPYAAVRILGEQKLYIADEDGNKNPNEWMDILDLIRHETAERTVTYHCRPEDVMIDIAINDNKKISVNASEFLSVADKLAEEIKSAKGSSFEVSDEIMKFLSKIEMQHMKAKSSDKSDVFLTARDPRASIVRAHIVFSIKSEFGHDPTLFNTAHASAAVYKLSGMNDTLMNQINALVDKKGHAAVSDRCKMLAQNCTMEFVGFPEAKKAGCAAFSENLDMINPRLPFVIDCMLRDHFFGGETKTDLNEVIDRVVRENPCHITYPEDKYPNMMNLFLYAAYCGMTASTRWNGTGQVNGGFIKVDKNGGVVAMYALESDAFKTYLYKNCYLEFPSTDEKHGFYGKVYQEGNDYYFRLNFTIRYK